MTFEDRVQKQIERLMRIKIDWSPEAMAKMRRETERRAREADEARNPTGHAIARAFRATNTRP